MSTPKPKRPAQPEWPTSGRILRYAYEKTDFANVPIGTTRPCIVVDSYESDRGPDDPLGELYDVVVFTAGTRDFQRGREGWMGFYAKQGVRLTETEMPGAISWPPRT